MWAVLVPVAQKVAKVVGLDELLSVVLQLLALELAVAVSMLVVVEWVSLSCFLVVSMQVQPAQMLGCEIGWASR